MLRYVSYNLGMSETREARYSTVTRTVPILRPDHTYNEIFIQNPLSQRMQRTYSVSMIFDHTVSYYTLCPHNSGLYLIVLCENELNLSVSLKGLILGGHSIVVRIKRCRG